MVSGEAIIHPDQRHTRTSLPCGKAVCRSRGRDLRRRRADQYVGEHATHADLESLRLCRYIVLDYIEKSHSAEEELIGGTLEEEVNHFKGRLIARALERQNGSVTRAAQELGLTRQGLSGILNGRHSKSIARAKRDRDR